MPNKVNLFPGVLLIVFSNLLIISSCCIKVTLENPCSALVHVGYWSIVNPFNVGVNYLNLISQSNDILDLLGSSDKCTYASWPMSAIGCVQCVVQSKYMYII